MRITSSKLLMVCLVTLTMANLAYSQVGINTETPSAMLDVVSKGNTATTKALEVNNTSDTEMLTVLDDGNVGINTPNPTAKLHTTGTVNMSGLSTNTSDTNVMTTDASGNLTTRTTTATFLLPQVLAGFDGLDAITTTATISSINGVATYTTDLIVKSFTITQKSLVTFSYSLSVGNILNSSGGNLTDNTSKQIGARLLWKSVPTGSPFSVGGVISTAGLPFTNGGTVYSSGSFYPLSVNCIVLNPGTYSVELKGYVFAYDNVQGIRATFGSGWSDKLDISAVPVQ